MSGPVITVLVVVACWLGLNAVVVIALTVVQRNERAA